MSGERLLSQGRYVEAARAFEREHRYGEALSAYRQGRAWSEVGRLLFSEARYGEAARAHLMGVPDSVRRGGRPDEASRRAMRSAAVAFGRAGDPGDAAALYILLGERERAADTLRRAGRRAEAVHVLQGGDVDADPLGRVRSKANPFAAARTPAQALTALRSVDPREPRYPEAARRAAMIAWQHDQLDMELDHWLGPWLRAQGVKRAPEDLQPLYSLGLLYVRHQLPENGEIAFRACLEVEPSLEMARHQLSRILDAREKKDISRLNKILEEDQAFRSAADPTGGAPDFANLPKLPELPDLPSLPELPSLDSLPAVDVEPPTRTMSHPGQRVPRPPSLRTPRPSAGPRTLSSPGQRAPQPPSRGPRTLSSPGQRIPTNRAGRPTTSPGFYRSSPASRVPEAPEPATITLELDDAHVHAITSESPLDPRQLQPGDRIAERYEVEKVLGRGGMGVVFAVTDRMLDEEVALKIISRPAGNDAEVKRFKEEMKICRRLQHPNIVRVFEFGAWRGNYFLTMELLDGEDLEGVIAKQGGPLPLLEAMPLLLQACDGLYAAHKDGIIHRDIKPPNLFVAGGGKTLKLMDFGIAKGAGSVDATLTAAGTVVGSPAYIAPERLFGKGRDTPQSDLYSLGIVIYEVLTGKPPFEAPELPALFMQHVNQAPEPLRRRNPLVPETLEAAVLKLLAKDPEERFPDARSLRKVLESSWGEILRAGI